MLSHRYLPADRVDARSERLTFDVPGTALLAVTLGAYALGMTIGRGAFGAADAGTADRRGHGRRALCARVESRTAQPLVRPSMLTDRVLSASLVANALVATVMMATLVVGPFYLARALGLSPVMVGLAMSAGPIVAALSGVPAGRIADTYGARRVALAGLGAVTLGAWLVSGVPGRLGVLAYVAPVAIVAAGYALFPSANNAAVMSEAAANQRGVVSGLLALSRNLGLVTGASVMGALFARASGAADVATAAPAAVALGMRVTFAVAGGLALVAFLLVANAGRGLRAAAAGGASNEA